MRTTPEPASHSPKFRDISTEGHLTLDVIFAVHQARYKARRNQVVNIELSSSEAEILPPDHQDPKCFLKFCSCFRFLAGYVVIARTASAPFSTVTFQLWLKLGLTLRVMRPTTQKGSSAFLSRGLESLMV
ncbi:hypothetical protein AVEN_142480-1 [Araneus ventricosus]|uniref:Uncharacterized protein n=1 Tax=Araneus ventricosus TaxID=182803 RepID=A0A4Y2DSX0_ARAVE|nr:hypothetical protein AVEN_142480-1 [Araneus ventricosus]